MDCFRQEKSLEKGLRVILYCGIILSTSVILWGAFAYFYQYGDLQEKKDLFAHVPSKLLTFQTIISAALQGNSLALVQFGLLLLMLTPLTRVFLALLIFIVKKELCYIGISLLLFFILLWSLQV